MTGRLLTGLMVTLGVIGLYAGPVTGSLIRSASPVPSCTAAHLRATGSWQGATNSMLGTIFVTNVGTSPCSLRGYLAPTLRDGNGKALPVAVRHAGPTLLPRPVQHPKAVVLAPSTEGAYFLIQWWNWCGTKPGQLSIHVALSARQSVSVTPMPPNGFSAATPGCIEGAHTHSFVWIAPVGKPG